MCVGWGVTVGCSVGFPAQKMLPFPQAKGLSIHNCSDEEHAFSGDQREVQAPQSPDLQQKAS